MGLEAGTHIQDLNSAWPLGSDLESTADDHLRLIKSVLKADFPNFNGTINSASVPLFGCPGDTNTGLYFPSADVIGLATGGTSRVTVASTGVSVIGIPLAISPGADVPAIVVTGAAGQRAGIDLQGNAGSGTQLSIFQDSSGLSRIFNRANTILDFSTNGTQRVTIGITNVDPLKFNDDNGVLQAAGYRDVVLDNFGANVTTVMGSRGRSLCAIASLTFTIAANASVAYPTGTVLTFINASGGNISIAINTDTMFLAGTATTGTRTLANAGLATAIKFAATSWLISGAGLS